MLRLGLRTLGGFSLKYVIQVSPSYGLIHEAINGVHLLVPSPFLCWFDRV